MVLCLREGWKIKFPEACRSDQRSWRGKRHVRELDQDDDQEQGRKEARSVRNESGTVHNHGAALVMVTGARLNCLLSPAPCWNGSTGGPKWLHPLLLLQTMGNAPLDRFRTVWYTRWNHGLTWCVGVTSRWSLKVTGLSSVLDFY